MSGTPEWLDEKGKIIEHKYCQCFLEQHPLLSKGEDFFTTEGVVTDKDRLLRDVFDDIKEHLTGGLVTKAKNLLEAIRMECYDRGELEKHLKSKRISQGLWKWKNDTRNRGKFSPNRAGEKGEATARFRVFLCRFKESIPKQKKQTRHHRCRHHGSQLHWLQIRIFNERGIFYECEK